MDKYLSRKFVLTVLSTIGGITISLTSMEGKIGTVCAVISAIIPIITYIITEGKIDAKAIELSLNAAKDVQTILEGEENGNQDN